MNFQEALERIRSHTTVPRETLDRQAASIAALRTEIRQDLFSGTVVPSQAQLKVGEKNPEEGNAVVNDTADSDDDKDKDPEESVEQSQAVILQADAQLGLVTCVVQRVDVPVYPASPPGIELYYDRGVVRQMAHSFAKNGLLGEIGYMHEEIVDGEAVKQNGRYGTVVENWTVPCDGVEINGHPVAQGDWIQTHHITDPELLQQIVDGELQSPSLSAARGSYALTLIED